jgi:hypothetical protein
MEHILSQSTSRNPATKEELSSCELAEIAIVSNHLIASALLIIKIVIYDADVILLFETRNGSLKQSVKAF